jgi:hypothetical protein
MLVHCSTLFKELKVNNALVVKKLALSSLGFVTCLLFLVSVTLIFSFACFVFRFRIVLKAP